MGQVKESSWLITSVGEDMKKFLANNFQQFLDYILKCGDSFKAWQSEVWYIRRNPDTLRRIDYERFLDRLETNDPGIVAAASAFDSNTLLLDLFATYCTWGRTFSGLATCIAESQAELTAMDPIDRHLLLTDDNRYMLWKLFEHGLTMEDMEFPDPLSDRVVDGLQKLNRDAIDTYERGQKIWKEKYPFNTSVDNESLDRLAERLKERPCAKYPFWKHRNRLIADFERARSDHMYNDEALTFVMGLLEKAPFSHFYLSESEKGTASRKYTQSQMVQAVIVSDYANYLSQWEPVADSDGDLTELIGYQGDRAKQFEIMRALSMRNLSKATMELQKSARTLRDLTGKKRFAFIDDPSIVLVKPEDIAAYELFCSLRMSNLRRYQ